MPFPPRKRVRPGWLVVIGCLAIGLTTAGCGGAGPAPRMDGGVSNRLEPDTVPTLAELHVLFQAELARLGIDPAKVVAAAPGAGNEVFDLLATQGTSGVTLQWTERLRGDYDQNGEVNVSDLTPVGHYMLAQVLYDAPGAHGGFPGWPSGDPLDTGGAGAGEVPAAGSGADNWRKARVDGNSDGEVNISELTPLGAGLGQRLDGYRIYRRGPSEADWTLLPNAGNAELAYTIPHPPAQPGRPVRYVWLDPGGSLDTEYRVAAYDVQSASEGPSSAPVQASPGTAAIPPTAVLTADRHSGSVPLTVIFDTSASLDPDGSVVLYELDFDGDGVSDLAQAAPIEAAQHIYNNSGSYQARLRVTDNDGLTGIISLTIQAGDEPQVSLVATPTSGEVPLTTELDASASADPGGDVLVYDWDLDGDGSFEYSSGLQSILEVELNNATQGSVAVRATSLIGLTAELSVPLALTDDYEEVEPNESGAQASPLGHVTLGAPVTGFRGSIGSPGYSGGLVDWLVFTTVAGVTLNIGVAHPQAGGGLAARLFAADGTTFIANGVHTAGLEAFSVNCVKAGRYVLRVQAADPTDAPAMAYTVSVLPTVLATDDVEPNDSALTFQPFPGDALTPGRLTPGEYVFYGQLDATDAEDWWCWVIPDRLSFFYTLDARLEFSHSAADLDLRVLRPDGSGGLEIAGSSLGTLDDELVVVTFPPLDFSADPNVYLRLTNFSGGEAYYALHLNITHN